MTFLRIVIPLYLLFGHVLFAKPVPTFAGHALGAAWPGSRDQDAALDMLVEEPALN